MCFTPGKLRNQMPCFIHGLALGLQIFGFGVASATAVANAAEPALPLYAHVVVIVAENKGYEEVMNGRLAPNIARLARTYGSASRFYGEMHPSEGNYVALLGGDTFGIYDNDAFYCRRGVKDRFCPGAAAAGYPDHTVRAPHLGTRLAQAGLTWKGYYEDLPAPGSLAVKAGAVLAGGRSYPAALYASKHSGFLNFADVQSDPQRAERLVGFGRLQADLAANRLPNFTLIVPNQCNDMHGQHGPGVPADCDWSNPEALIQRGDRIMGELVAQLEASSAWRSAENMAIVTTFDEGEGREGCCGITPNAPSNFGGGHIPTLVLTNHGPRGRVDDTPYSHYSLLRTIEDVFGLPGHLGHAADTARGVRSMTPLFTPDP
jgi:phosphatidylinositol-3-phosphatase